VSAHVRERLSAYLDGEVPREERAGIDAHLAACPACARRLEDLAVVDSAVAGLLLPEPEGDADFAARVRARIEAETSARGLDTSARRRLPAWTWAAAAALLVAVVTPLTLREFRVSQEGSGPAALAPAAPAARAGDDSQTIRAGGTGAEAQAQVEKKQPAELHFAKPAPGRGRPESRAKAGEHLQDESAKPVPAAEPHRGDGRSLDLAAPPPPAAPPLQEASAEQREQGLGVEGGVPQGVVGGVVSGTTDARSAFAPAPQRAAPAGADAAKQVRRDENAPAPSAAATPSDAAMKTRELSEAEAFGRLEQQQAKSAAEWRRLREAWRVLARTRGDHVRADEAAVRAIEAAAAAYRASGDEKDARVLERDVAEYLARKDAAQPERVRRVLRDTAP
jgi:hypothetical protein